MEQYKIKLEQFKTELNIFHSIKTGEKITKNTTDNTLHIDYPDSFQWVRRWWWGENRKKTVSHLDEVFTKFMKFLDHILAHIKYNGLNNEYRKLTDEINVFINSIMVGLHNLKFTYPQYAELHCKIGSIILTMLDFKDEIRRFSVIKRKRSNSFAL